MYVTNQLAEQVTQLTTAGAPKAKATEGGKSEFEAMLDERSARPMQDEAPTTQKQEGPAAGQKAPEGPISDEQQELAAALITAQPVIPNISLQAQPVETQLQTPVSELGFMQTEANPQLSMNAATQPSVEAPVAEAELAGVQNPASEAKATTQTHEPTVRSAETQAPAQTGETTGIVEAKAGQQPSSQQSFSETGSETTAQAPKVEAKTSETAMEAPLFQNVEAVPLKVAEAPIAERAAPTADLSKPDAADALAKTIGDAFKNGSGTVEIKLSPENLGSMTVQITRADDGSIGVILKATTDRAAGILEQHSANLQSLLAASTQSAVKLEVQTQSPQQSLEQFLNPDDSNGRNNHQQPQQQSHQKEQTQDFISQLRLGLVDTSVPA